MGTILYTTDPNATTGFREATFEELIAGARHALAIRVRKGAVMASPNAARDYLTMRLAPRDHEVFTILFLDSRHRLIDCLEIFRGTIDGDFAGSNVDNPSAYDAALLAIEAHGGPPELRGGPRREVSLRRAAHRVAALHPPAFVAGEPCAVGGPDEVVAAGMVRHAALSRAASRMALPH